MRHPIVFGLLAALAFISRGAGQGESVGINSQAAWQGYLIDVLTVKEFLKSPGNAMRSASQYARTTALVPENSASGFGVLTEGKWLKFDSAGNVQALDLLRNTKTEKGIMVVVTGSLKGDELSVSSIRETPASGFRKNY